MTTKENAGEWAPPEGWHHRTLRHASHACGWTCAHPAADVGGYTAACEAHAKACPWPDEPELVETVSD